MKQIKAGIIGASGYAGAELLRILLVHPQVEVCAIGARSYVGQSVASLYPGFQNCSDLVFETNEAVIAKSDIIFASLPHGLSEAIAATCHKQNKKFIDLGADFRLYEEEDYQTWYNLTYQEKELHKLSIYGLSEWNSESIAKANIIGNPGCYPTSIALGCMPALVHNIVDPSHIIIDSKSGVTGAGKEANDKTHYPRCNEGFSPYKAAEHRHTPEIEQTLQEMAKQEVKVTFVPHLLPVNRGIVSTMYLPLTKDITIEEIHALYTKQYAKSTFVRVLPLGSYVDLKFVAYSNYCDISLHLDTRTNTLIIASTIDNMVKGAAGQAVQNMNIMYGLKEDTGLQMIAPSF